MSNEENLSRDAINIDLQVYMSIEPEEEDLINIIEELSRAGYQAVWADTHFEVTNVRQDCDEPEVVFDNLLTFDSRIRVRVLRCNKYTLWRS